MMYDIVVFLNSVFVRPHLNEKPVFSKIFTLGNVFKNLRFGGPKTPFTCEQKAVKWRKNIRFQKYPDTCGWALSLCLFVCFFFSDVPFVKWMTFLLNMSHVFLVTRE